MRLLVALVLAACTRTPAHTSELYAVTVTEHLADGGVRTGEVR